MNEQAESAPRRAPGRPKEALPMNQRNHPVTAGLGWMQLQMLHALRNGPLTTSEVQSAFANKPRLRSIRQSLGYLVDRKLVLRSGSGVSPAGRKAILWTLTRPGLKLVREQEGRADEGDE